MFSDAHYISSKQATDGTWTFLHPTNLRCLLHHYKSYDACPRLLEANVLELEDVIQVGGKLCCIGLKEGSGCCISYRQRCPQISVGSHLFIVLDEHCF